MNSKIFSLTIRNPQDYLFRGNVAFLSSYNSKGIFSILPDHSNFITLIQERIIFEDEEGREHTINFKNGILKAIKNNVELFLAPQ